MKNTRAQAKVVPAVENISADALVATMRNVLEENDRLRSENALYQRLQAEFDQLQAEVQASEQQRRAENREAVVNLVEDQLWSQGDMSLLQDLFTPQPNAPGRGKRWLMLFDHDPALTPPRPVLTPNLSSPRQKKRSRSCASAASGDEDSTDEDKTETRAAKTRRRKKQA